MINGKSILAIIPARGGSKGIPRKNIKLLSGKPLISYTIGEGLKSRYIDRMIVSTEDEEIAYISKSNGAEVPFLRPDELGKDDTPGIDPIIHAIKWIEENENTKYDYVCLLQCTSPLRTSAHIDEAIEKLIDQKGQSIVSVCESKTSPYWMQRIENDYLIDFIKQDEAYTRRQDIPLVYNLNGAIYIAKREIILENKSFFIKNTMPYIMDRLTSLDIDDILDFKFAEMLIQEKENE